MFKTKYKIMQEDGRYCIYKKEFFDIGWYYQHLFSSIDEAKNYIKTRETPIWEGYAKDLNT